MKRITFLLILLLFTACSGGGGSSSEAPQKTENTIAESDESENVEETKSLKFHLKRKVELEKGMNNLDDFKNNINSYEVHAIAKSGDFYGAQFECEKILFDRTNNKTSSSFDNSGQEATVDIDLLSTDPSLVYFECSVRVDDFNTETVKFEIKKSYVITGRKSFQTKIAADSIGTLLLEENSELTTNGESINLHVEELISNKGKIVTFTEDEVTETRENTNGASGGIISFNIGTGIGQVTFELRGKNGGIRTGIPEMNKAVPPADAKLNGKCTITHPEQSNVGPCLGKRGNKGFRGHQGFPGLKGGGPGILKLMTTKAQSLEIEVLHFPGKGSAGAKGGKGGIGGPGGIGDTLIYRDSPETSGSCPRCSPSESNYTQKLKYADGAPGPEGDVGEDGVKGMDGSILESITIFKFENLDFLINKDWKNF